MLLIGLSSVVEPQPARRKSQEPQGDLMVSIRCPHSTHNLNGGFENCLRLGLRAEDRIGFRLGSGTELEMSEQSVNEALARMSHVKGVMSCDCNVNKT